MVNRVDVTDVSGQTRASRRRGQEGAGAGPLWCLDGRVGLVTGASYGLAAFFAAVLAEAGADLVPAARSSSKLAETARRVESLGRVTGTVLPVDGGYGAARGYPQNPQPWDSWSDEGKPILPVITDRPHSG